MRLNYEQKKGTNPVNLTKSLEQVPFNAFLPSTEYK